MVSVPAAIVGRCSILATGVLRTPGHSGSFVRLGLREPRVTTWVVIGSGLGFQLTWGLNESKKVPEGFCIGVGGHL